MINRRQFNIGSALAFTTALPSLASLANASEINEDGLHIQDWFLQTFLEIGEDQKEMSGQNKHLAILFEQKGCPYCKEMHNVNFANDKIVNYIKQHFGVLQINMWGSKGVTDLDGIKIEEKELARKWRVNFTPTIVFLRQGDLDGVPFSLAQAVRMPGYLKPYHFMSMFEFVAEKQYENQVFQQYLRDKNEKLKAEGKKPGLL
jgi:thioredoxin-related protein